MLLLVKKGEIFRCWNCDNPLITDVKEDIYADILIDNMSRYCVMRTQSPPHLRHGKSPLDNISKCAYCGVKAYEQICKSWAGKLPDELFEI